MSTTVSTIKRGSMKRSKEKEDFLQPVFDPHSTAYNTFFTDYGINRYSLSSLLWMVRGIQYYQLRHVAVCGPDGRTQQEIPAKILFSENGFFDGILSQIPPGSVILEALPTADSATNDPTGYIHSQVRGKGQFKLGYLATGVAETGKISIRDRTIPHETRYGEPMNVVYYQKYSSQALTPLVKTRFCVESARQAYANSLKELGNSQYVGAKLGAFFDPRTQEELEAGFLEEGAILSIMEKLRVMSGYKRKITQEFLLNGAYPLKIHENYLNNTAFSMLTEVMDREKVMSFLFNSFDQPPLQVLDAKFKSTSKKILKSMLVQFEKIQEMIPGGHVILCSLELDTSVYSTRGRQSKAYFLMTTKPSFGHSLLKVDYNGDQTHNNAVEVTRGNGDKVYLFVVEGVYMVLYFLNGSEEQKDVNVVNAVRGFPIDLFSADFVSNLVKDLYELGLENTIEKYPDSFKEPSSDLTNDEKLEMILTHPNAIPVDLTYKDEQQTEWSFDQIEFKNDQILFDEDNDCLEINCYTCNENKEDANCAMFQLGHTTVLFVICRENYYLCMMALYTAVKLDSVNSISDYYLKIGTGMLILNNHERFKGYTNFSDIDNIFEHVPANLSVREDLLKYYAHLKYFDLYGYLTAWNFQSFDFKFTNKVVKFLKDQVSDNGKTKVNVDDFKKDKIRVNQVSMILTYDYKDNLKAIKHSFDFKFKKDSLIVISHFGIESERYVYKVLESRFFELLELTKFNLYEFCETLNRNFEDIFFDMNGKLDNSLKCQALLEYVVRNKPFNHFTDFLCKDGIVGNQKVLLNQAYISLLNKFSKSQYSQSFRYLNIVNKLNEIIYIKNMNLESEVIGKGLQYTQPLKTFLEIMTTVSNQALPVVHVKNDFENTSFWNYCNGEVLDLKYEQKFFDQFTFPDNASTGTLFSLLVSIYISLLTYAHSEKNFVSSAMDENMNNYVTYLFSMCSTFRKFVDYVMKSLNWFISDEQLLVQDLMYEQIEAISLFLNLDIQIYELQDLKKTLCKNNFVISRIGRFNVSLNQDHMFLDSNLSNHELFAFSSRGIEKLSAKRANRQIWVECIITESAEKFLNGIRLRTTSFQRDKLNQILENIIYNSLPGNVHLKSIYLDALAILRESSMLHHEEDDKWLEQSLDEIYDSSVQDEFAFRETNDMTLWKCQMMMQMVVSSHYHDLENFYYSDDYAKHRPKSDNEPYVRFSTLFLEEMFDCFIKFVDNYFFDLKDFKILPVDLEIISEYLGIGITFLEYRSFNNVIKSRKVLLRRSKLESLNMIKIDLPTGVPYSDCVINWQFGECYETDTVNLYLEKNLVLYSDDPTNDEFYKLSSEKEVKIVMSRNPENLTKFSNSKQDWSHHLRFRSKFRKKRQTMKVGNIDALRPSYEAIVSNNEMIENIFETLRTFLDCDQLKKEMSKKENADLCKQMFYAHKKQEIIIQEAKRFMVFKEMLNAFLYAVDNIDSLKEYLKTSFNYFPTALLELIAKASKKRFITVIFRTKNSSCRSVSDMFRIDDSSFHFYESIDYKNSYDIIKDTHIFIVQPLRKEGSLKVEDGGSDIYMVCAVGVLPSDIIETMTQEQEEEPGNDSGQEGQSDVESKFQLGAQNYLGVVHNENPLTKKKWVTPIPIHLLQPLPEVPKELVFWFPEYEKMFATRNFQPIIMTHRSFPKPINSYSIRNFPYKITAEMNSNQYDEMGSYAQTGREQDRIRVDTKFYEELYDFETLASTYLNERKEKRKHQIDLELKIDIEDIQSQAIQTFSDILRCIRITLAVTKASNWKDLPVNSKFFNEISKEARGSEFLQYMFRTYGVFAQQDENDFFSFKSSGKKQYYRVSCHGIWNPKNITMSIAMRILNYYIHYLEQTDYTYILANNDCDKLLLEFLRTTRDRWFNYNKETKSVDGERYLVKLDVGRYDEYYRQLQLTDTQQYTRIYEADIRALSILYHLDFKKLTGFGSYESNSFIETPFTFLLQQRKPQARGAPKIIKYYTFENVEKKRKENKPTVTITNRFYRNINFPPWIRQETELGEVGKMIYNTEKNFYKKFANYPRLTIYILPSKPEDSTPVIGHLFIKGKSINVDELDHPEKIEDRWEPTDQEIKENKDMKERKEKKKEKKDNPEKKDKSKSDDGEKAKVVFSGACNNYDEWEERGDYHDSDEDFKYKADQGNFRERGGMSLYRSNGKRDYNVYQDANGNSFRTDRHGRRHFNSKLSLGSSAILPFNSSVNEHLLANAQPTRIYAEESNKEIHMLTLCLAHLIVGLDNLADGGYMTSKFNKGLLTQSRMLATMLLPCFDEVTAYPVPIFTDHILFAGKGFSRANMLKHKVLDRLKGCMDLSENSVRREYETLMACYDDKTRWEKFETRVDSCSEQLMYQSCVDDWRMAQVLIESTFSRDGMVSPGSGGQAWLDAATASAFNKRVFSKISRDERAANQSLLQALVQTDYGMQLRNVFAPVIAKLEGPRASPGRVELVDSDE